MRPSLILNQAIYWVSEPILWDHLLVNYFRSGLGWRARSVINMHALIKTEHGLHHYLWDFAIVTMEGRYINLKIYDEYSLIKGPVTKCKLPIDSL